MFWRSKYFLCGTGVAPSTFTLCNFFLGDQANDTN